MVNIFLLEKKKHSHVCRESEIKHRCTSISSLNSYLFLSLPRFLFSPIKTEREEKMFDSAAAQLKVRTQRRKKNERTKRTIDFDGNDSSMNKQKA